MPARSKAQYRLVRSLRRKYGIPEETPPADKWVWEADWTDGVDFDKLPEKTASTADLTAPPAPTVQQMTNNWVKPSVGNTTLSESETWTMPNLQVKGLDPQGPGGKFHNLKPTQNWLNNLRGVRHLPMFQPLENSSMPFVYDIDPRGMRPSTYGRMNLPSTPDPGNVDRSMANFVADSNVKMDPGTRVIESLEGMGPFAHPGKKILGYGMPVVRKNRPEALFSGFNNFPGSVLAHEGEHLLQHPGTMDKAYPTTDGWTDVNAARDRRSAGETPAVFAELSHALKSHDQGGGAPIRVPMTPDQVADGGGVPSQLWNQQSDRYYMGKGKSMTGLLGTPEGRQFLERFGRAPEDPDYIKSFKSKFPSLDPKPMSAEEAADGIRDGAGLDKSSGLLPDLTSVAGLTEAMTKLVHGPFSKFIRREGNVPRIRYPAPVSLGPLKALGPATTPLLPTATTAGLVAGAGAGAVHGLVKDPDEGETRLRRFLRSLGKGSVIGAGSGLGAGVLAGGAADTTLGLGLDRVNDAIKETGYTLPNELLPYIKEAMDASRLTRAAIAKAAANPGAQFQARTGTPFDPKSPLDRYNMSASEANAPTMSGKQWAAAGRPSSFIAPDAIARWNPGNQRAPLDRRMTAPVEPAPARQPGPRENPFTANAQYARGLARQAQAPVQDPNTPPPGFVGSGVTGQPESWPGPVAQPQAPATNAWTGLPEQPPARNPYAPPPGFVGSGVTGQPEDPSYRWPAEDWNRMTGVQGRPPGWSGNPPSAGAGWPEYPSVAGQPESWPGPVAQPQPPATNMWTGLPEQPAGQPVAQAPDAWPAYDAGGSPMTPITDPWEELTTPQPGAFPEEQAAVPVEEPYDPWAGLMDNPTAPQQDPYAAQQDPYAAPPPSPEPPPAAWPPPPSQEPYRPQRRINPLTGYPMGYNHPAPPPEAPAPAAIPVQEDRPPVDFGPDKPLNHRVEYATKTVWPAYQEIKRKARAGQATQEELDYMGQAGRLFSSLEGERTQAMDSDRMRRLRYNDPDSWLKMREAIGEVPRFDARGGGYAMR